LTKGPRNFLKIFFRLPAAGRSP